MTEQNYVDAMLTLAFVGIFGVLLVSLSLFLENTEIGRRIARWLLERIER